MWLQLAHTASLVVTSLSTWLASCESILWVRDAALVRPSDDNTLLAGLALPLLVLPALELLPRDIFDILLPCLREKAALGSFNVHGSSSGIIVWWTTNDERLVHSLSNPYNNKEKLIRQSTIIDQWESEILRHMQHFQQRFHQQLHVYVNA